MIKEIVEAKASAGEVLEAIATLENATAYINRYNFFATNILSTTPLRFSLMRDDSWNKTSKQLTRAEIVSHKPSDVSFKILETSRKEPDLRTVPEGMIISRIEMSQDRIFFVCEQCPSSYVDAITQAA